MSSKKKKKCFSAVHFTSVFSMSLVLLIIGLAVLLLLTARDMGVYIRENISLRIELADDIQDAYRQRIERYLTSTGFAKSIEYASKEDALALHIESFGENPEKFLGYNPLKASLEVKLKAEYATADSMKMIERKLKAFENIYRIDYPTDVVDFVNSNVKKLTVVLFGITLLLLIISIALINNTVRLTVYSNRFIINTMKLVGANRWFIRKPYMRQGLLNGFFAAIIALIFLSLVVAYALRELGLTAFQIPPLTILAVVIIVFIAGIAITAFSSYIAVGRYLRMKTDDIYFA